MKLAVARLKKIITKDLTNNMTPGRRIGETMNFEDHFLYPFLSNMYESYFHLSLNVLSLAYD
jgi:hypothetical protein